MGKVKSTLDLVMEKTRNMKLGEAERLEQKRQEAKGLLMGLLQKYEDQHLQEENFQKKWAEIRTSYNLSDNQMLLEATLDRLDLQFDNRLFLHLLEKSCAIDTSAISALLKEFRAALQDRAQERSQKIKATLAKEHLISGPALVPNLEADPGWISTSQEVRRQFEALFRQAKEALKYN